MCYKADAVKQRLDPLSILVTGCSCGFGLLIAARLSSQGHYVYATMRNLEKSNALLDEVQKREGRIHLLRLDVTKPDTITEVINDIKVKYGRIDVLINNAGFGIGGFFEDLSDEEIREQMETNFFGVLNVTRAVIPLMRKESQGKIINISSVSGLSASPALGAYCASKWALEGFSESLHFELKDFGIQVVLVEPGLYRTEIFHKNARHAKDFDNPKSPYYEMSQFLRNRIAEISNKCTKGPENIAELVDKIVQSKNPSFRNIPDAPSRLRLRMRRILPFNLYSRMTSKIIFKGFPSDRKP